MNSTSETTLRNALSGMASGPRDLLLTLNFFASHEEAPTAVSKSELIELIGADPNGPVRRLMNDYLSRWDWEDNAAWTAATKANSPERRHRVYELLRIDSEFQEALDKYIPHFQGAKAVVIDDPKAVRGWYSSDFRASHYFYWEALRDFLADVRGLSADVINSIESSANRIVERLADPASRDVFASRGLVVGHVQSGKTTNFTAVIAKAIDAGYRLIIVLSGTTNLLRNQTQRRLDMELTGVENIQRSAKGNSTDHDYAEDEGWPSRFISYGSLPSLRGSVDIHRLTTQEDFTSKSGGLNALEFDFEKRDRRAPLYDRVNLDHTGARIAVVKKQTDRLKALIRELGRDRCVDVPTLIIDDESDQASINTVDPNKKHPVDKKRSGINNCLVELLRKLPRAQYLGYTATPFANVFVSPHDPEDLYPRHFIVSLERPAGYMGAREFLDFQTPDPGRLTNRSAYIREVPKDDAQEDDRLIEAMDSYVLAGALKKYRESKGAKTFKHHTMLYHRSVKQGDQLGVAKRLRGLWVEAGYASPGPAFRRLEKLLDRDFKPVWKDRGEALGLTFPSTFSDLKRSVGLAIDEICRGGDPVLMVNSAEGSQAPDFDSKVGVWKIVVGGAKLSRGYTIEGLTVSYFRRPAQMQDTLMQMGRWFGYRPGYSDLVRLYIGVSERYGNKTLNLYNAFNTMCRDEEEFRDQLIQYAGENGVTPMQIPALVFNSYPTLRPTARNKMFHAKLVSASFNYREPTSQASDQAGRTHNEKLIRKLLAETNVKTQPVRFGSRRFDVKWTMVANEAVLGVLGSFRWSKTGRPIDAEIGYLKRQPSPVDGWIFLAPQIEKGSSKEPWIAAEQEFLCVGRTKETIARFGTFSSPEHADFARWLVGGPDKDFESELRPSKRTGIFLFYPTLALKDGKVAKGAPVMGFALVLPAEASAGPSRSVWVVNM